jgi:diguanylate cyclase (GGDEF)-like protein
MITTASRLLQRSWNALPKGIGLPDEVWRRRHRGIVVLLWLHVAGLVAFGLLAGHDLAHTLTGAGVVAAGSAVAGWHRRSRSFQAGAATVALLTASALLVHLSGGLIEMHFHFFVALGIISLYQDWVPFSLSIGYVVVHHGAMGMLDPHSVYNHPAAERHPFVWAAIHGGFVLAASVANLTAWRLNEEGYYDPLTGLANRKLFLDRLVVALARTERYQSPMSVLFLDLDDFKAVNDRFGHGAGDELLAAVAERLRRGARPTDTVARLSGDEFAVLVEHLDDTESASRVGERLLDALVTPFTVAGKQVSVRATVGIAVSTSGRESPDELLANADLAMYTAKASGKGGCQVFEPTMHAALVERLELEADLRGAVGRGELTVHYQPVVTLDTGRCAAVEALVRWNHPEHGLVPPLKFIPLAEAIGVIGEIGEFVLGQACRQARRWQLAYPGDPPLSVAVNLSAAQLTPGLVETVAQALREAELDPRSLILEITESMLIEEAEETMAYLTELKALGVRLAIDDFGTGYSSLSRLRAFPVDELKIDRSFINDIESGREGVPLAASMIAMGHTLGLEVVAEGVETATQLAFLGRQGCDRVQGYLLARPMEADAIDRLLADAAATREVAGDGRIAVPA